MASKKDSSLSERQKHILRCIVDSYVANGDPVGSQNLLDASGLTCSSATIRADMAELERKGYLIQPHISAGRIPTQYGYRFYVESLMERYKFTAMEVMELNNMLKNKFQELDSILESATKFVSSLTNYTTVALKAGNKIDSVSKFTGMMLSGNEFLLVMKTSDGKISTKQITSSYEINDNIIHNLCDVLNENIINLNSSEINLPLIMSMKKKMGMYEELVTKSVEAVYELVGTENETNLQIDGVKKLLDYPEFSDVDKMRNIMNLIEDKQQLINLMTTSETNTINVRLGTEDDKLVDDSALIYRTINVGGKVVGAIGVLGPARMDYSKVISTVEYMTDKIVSVLTNSLEPGKDPPRLSDKIDDD